MAEVNFKEVKLEELFSYKRGNSKYTRKYCNNNIGEYEVFTGATIQSFGFINTYDYDCELLTYSTDGEYAGTLKLLNGKFNVGGHRAILEPKSDRLNLKYFKYTLQNTLFNKVKKGDVPSIAWREIRNSKASVPIDHNGNFDLEKQNEIVKKYEMLERRKKEIEEKLNHINEVEVDFLDGSISKSKQIHFEDLFDIERGKVISRSYINENGGDYPVYSTQIDEPFGFIDDYMYDGEYLIWNTDGLGGYIRLVNDKFSITNIVGIMKLKEIYKGKVNLEFIRRILQPIFRSNTKGREGIDGKNEYTKINSTMIRDLDIKIDFPVDKNGEIDLEKQNEIVEKFGTIDEMKRKITDKGLPFIHANIELDGLTPYIYIYIYNN